MSNYFSKLAARAAGAVGPASILPGPLPEPAASDPFEAAAPSEFNAHAPAVSETAPPVSRELTPEQRPAEITLPEPPPMLTEQAEPVDRPDIKQPVSRPISLQRVADTRIAPALVTPIPLQETAQREEAPAMAAPLGSSRELNPVAEEGQERMPPEQEPFFVRHIVEPPQESAQTSPHEPAAHPAMRYERETMAPPPPLPALVREVKTILAPPMPEEPAVVDPEPSQPRLVIGQLRVEVVSAPPATAAPQVVRVVERRLASNDPAALLSKLRFGLGQM